MIKELGWGPQQLVDWLLCSDVHFILSHVHKGMSALGESQMGWNMLLLQKQLMRLRDHRGYPNGDKLQCPIFLQDKLKYIELVFQFSIPTFSISCCCVSSQSICSSCSFKIWSSASRLM